MTKRRKREIEAGGDERKWREKMRTEDTENIGREI